MQKEVINNVNIIKNINNYKKKHNKKNKVYGIYKKLQKN